LEEMAKSSPVLTHPCYLAGLTRISKSRRPFRGFSFTIWQAVSALVSLFGSEYLENYIKQKPIIINQF
jgi:hypothetical protein